MKRFFCLCIALVVSASLFAQKDWRLELDFAEEDSLMEAMGFMPVEYQMLLFADRWCFKAPEIINNDSLLNVFNQYCGLKGDSIDISKDVLLNAYFGGDCHVKFRHYMYLDTVNKKMVWKVYNIYGGCRAWGGRHFLVKAPQPPEGYTIEIDEVYVERVKGKWWGDE